MYYRHSSYGRKLTARQERFKNEALKAALWLETLICGFSKELDQGHRFQEVAILTQLIADVMPGAIREAKETDRRFEDSLKKKRPKAR